MVPLIGLVVALAAHAAPARPTADLSTLFTSDDYPAEALRDGSQGSVTVRLDIGKEGRVASCLVTKTSGFSLLDGRTCAVIMERAQLLPARGKLARTSSGTTTTINWIIPEGLNEREPADNWVMDVAVLVDHNAVTSCSAAFSNNDHAEEKSSCADASAAARQIVASPSFRISQPYRLLVREEHIVGDTVPLEDSDRSSKQALMSFRNRALNDRRDRQSCRVRSSGCAGRRIGIGTRYLLARILPVRTLVTRKP